MWEFDLLWRIWDHTVAIRGGRYGKAILGEVQVPGGEGVVD
jgi:hypothetical protein